MNGYGLIIDEIRGKNVKEVYVGQAPFSEWKKHVFTPEAGRYDIAELQLHGTDLMITTHRLTRTHPGDFIDNSTTASMTLNERTLSLLQQLIGISSEEPAGR
jgi:hypothetical protein